MTVCYLCNKKISDDEDSIEHIIPNAIGGRLKVKNILCKACNSKLGKELDKPFIEMFDVFYKRLNLIKDRRSNIEPLPCKCNFRGRGELEAFTQNYKIFPKSPFYYINKYKKEIVIVCNENTYKQYKIFVEKSVKKILKNYSKYSFINIDDMSGMVTYDINLDNDLLRNGINKIAINFALFSDVPLEYLQHLVSKEEGKIKNENGLLVFYPLSDFEMFVERNRSIIDDYYPNHLLLLFTHPMVDQEGNEKRALICYVELFSVFQFYTLLNMDYDGPNIYNSYYQSIIKEEVKEIKLHPLDPKELSMFSKKAGINLNELDKNLRDKGIAKWDDRYEFIHDLIEKKLKEPKYNRSLFNVISTYIDNISMPLTIAFAEKSDNKEIYSKNPLFKEGSKMEKIYYLLTEESNEKLLSMMYCIKYLFHYIDDERDAIVDEKPYKKYYMKWEGKGIYDTYMKDLFQYNEDHKAVLTEYNHHKTRMLLDYINKITDEKKKEMAFKVIE